MHLKRNEMPKIWPIERKGTTYVVCTVVKNSIPLLIALRNMLKLARNRKDAKNILKSAKIKVNNKEIKDEKYPLTLFDILTLDGKSFKLVIENKKFKLIDVKGKEAEEKIVKVIGKKMLNKGKLQVNLADGRNYLIKEKINTNDSVLINFKENKIAEILKFGEKCRIFFISGKHIGEEGEAEKIEGKKIIVKTKHGKINAELKNLMVIK